MAIARVGAEGMAEALCVPGIPLRGQVTRVVDRSFVEDGVRWIVDYKTTDFGLEVAPASLAAHAERYRAQLEAYAALFADEALPRRLAVFYATHGKLVSLN
jgi:ATP-dependent exoDNAse (exonuclease V) beta subunit